MLGCVFYLLEISFSRSLAFQAFKKGTNLIFAQQFGITFT